MTPNVLRMLFSSSVNSSASRPKPLTRAEFNHIVVKEGRRLCEHCGKHVTQHADNPAGGPPSCLFAPTTFSPVSREKNHTRRTYLEYRRLHRERFGG